MEASAGTEAPGLSCFCSLTEDAAGKDEAGRVRGWNEGALHQQFVETDFHGLIFMAGLARANFVK